MKPPTTPREMIAHLQRENAELETTLKLVYDANQRGIKAWQQAHPDKAMVWPDQAKLVEWLVRENAALRELAARMATEMRETDHEFASLQDYEARKEAQP